jgi:hypothetical protein
MAPAFQRFMDMERALRASLPTGIAETLSDAGHRYPLACRMISNACARQCSPAAEVMR